jgi:hypothetical protein
MKDVEHTIVVDWTSAKHQIVSLVEVIYLFVCSDIYTPLESTRNDTIRIASRQNSDTICRLTKHGHNHLETFHQRTSETFYQLSKLYFNFNQFDESNFKTSEKLLSSLGQCFSWSHCEKPSNASHPVYSDHFVRSGLFFISIESDRDLPGRRHIVL